MNRKNEHKILASGSTTHYSKQTDSVFESRSSFTGFQSFLKWFRKNEHERFLQNTSNINKSGSIENGYHHQIPKIYDSTDTLSRPSSPSVNNGLSPSSSCDSVFSTSTTGFAFIPPNQYKPYGNASQPEKLIAPGPATDTYRNRLRAHKTAIEIDKKLELTLRTKYKIFDAATINFDNLPRSTDQLNRNSHQYYTDFSLPQHTISQTINGGTSNGYSFTRRKSHRRTVSDSSKDKKAGAYVHVKGKRKAPQPPVDDRSGSLNDNYTLRKTGTLSPVSTLGRKKRRAPAPPPQQSLNEEIPTVLANGLFDDEEIKAIIGVNSSYKAMDKSNLLNKPSTSANAINSSENVPSTDTLKLERGILRSNRDSLRPPNIDTKIDEKTPAVSLSPISPRPWYKRSPAANKDYAIPFKKEIILRTMEKRRNKHTVKEIDSPLLPEVGFSRNSSLFDGFFSRINHDDHDKRKSGIGIPNISELDREAAEIVSKEQACVKAKQQAEREKYFVNSDEVQLQTNMYPLSEPSSPNENCVKRISTKDLISKFEATNVTKFTINNSYIDKSERNIDNEPNHPNAPDNNFKYRLEQTNKPYSMTQSIFSNIRQHQVTTQKSESEENSLINCVSPQKENENNIVPDTNIDAKRMWICSYCTLENPNWRVICEVCERIKPFDKQATTGDVVTSPPQAGNQSSKITVNKNVARNRNSDRITKEQRIDWETKAEKVMKYFRPRSTGNALSKSASETSVGKPIAKKTLITSKLSDSPKLGAQPKKYGGKSAENNPDIIRPPVRDSDFIPKDVDKNDIKKGLIDSSAVVTTITSIFMAPNPIQQNEENITASLPNIDEIRSARLAKFSDIGKTSNDEIPPTIDNINNTTNTIENTAKNMFNEPGSLEREKERLRDMIRAMNARALAEKYPVIQKNASLDNNESTIIHHAASTGNITTSSTFNQNMADGTKLGAIKKLFQRKQDIDDQEIADNTNFNNSKVDREKCLKVSSFTQTAGFNKPQRPDVLLLPSPIQEMNEDEKSPISPLKLKKSEELVSLKQSKLQNFYENIKDTSFALNDKDQKNIEEISQQLNTPQGLEDFKATLRSTGKKISNTNTLALNKILKNLEMSIADGKHEMAANLAMDLAKMKVSLSVTKQPSAGAVGMTSEEHTVIVDMFVEDKDTHKGPIQLSLSKKLTVFDLKTKISKDFDIPVDVQRWILNNNLAVDNSQILYEFGIKEKSVVYLYIIAPDKEKSAAEKEKENFDLKISNVVELQPGTSQKETNDNMNIQKNKLTFDQDDECGAQALPLPTPTNLYNTLKIGWACSLCTLINTPNRPGCIACSQSRPADYVVPPEYKLSEDNFEIPDELKKFLYDENDQKIKILEPEKRNDLNKINVCRKSSEMFNIIVAETTTTPIEKVVLSAQEKKLLHHTPIVMTAITSPNITKNKYRGVDNYNPHVNKKSEVSLTTSLNTTTPNLIKPAGIDLKNNLANPEKVPDKISEKKKTPPPIETINSNHYTELLNLDNSNAIASIEPFECPICFMKFGSTEGVILRDCLHTFCRECIVNTVKYSEEAEVKCPYMDADYSCESILQEREIKALVTKEVYEEHLAISLRLAEHRIDNAFHCKTPNCRGWCIYEDNVNQFKCPICKITNCLTCRVIHDGLNCKQFQDRMNSDCDSNIDARRTKEMLADMIEKGDAMNCPTCQVILMKKWGCDWLKCSMCKTEICWVTRGIRWGPEGKGDTSAGCKCGVNGIKCHPKCNYCH